MRERLFSVVRPTARRASVAIDLVPVTPMRGGLATLLVPSMDPRAREPWILPWDAPRDVETLDDGAARVCRAALGGRSVPLEQVGAFGDGQRHPGEAEISITFAALVPLGGASVALEIEARWFDVDALPALAPRQQRIVAAALESLRARLDLASVAFRLLPPAFTLTELQAVYELLVGRALHKASFRRTLQAAGVVEPLAEWRSDGRGRPAQLFRRAPVDDRAIRRGVRFELL